MRLHLILGLSLGLWACKDKDEGGGADGSDGGQGGEGSGEEGGDGTSDSGATTDSGGADSTDSGSDGGGDSGEPPEEDPALPESGPIVGELAAWTLGDIDGDGVVGEVDRDRLIELIESGAEPACPAAQDLSGDGLVDWSDLEMLELWLDGEPALEGAPLATRPELGCTDREPTAWISDSDELLEVRWIWRGGGEPAVDVTSDGGYLEWLLMEGEDVRAVVRKPTTAGVLTTLRIQTDSGLALLTQESTALEPVFASALEPVIAEELELAGTLGPSTGECPELGEGCEVLIIDMVRNSAGADAAARADDVEAALAGSGCSLRVAAPSLRQLPQPQSVQRRGEMTVVLLPDPVEVAAATAHNRAAMEEVAAAIREHWLAVQAGVELELTLVVAHGSRDPSCGAWSPGVPTGVANLQRSLLWTGTWQAAAGHSCQTAAEDWSCYGGQSATAWGQLNNGGAPDCATAVAQDHRSHAGHGGDLAIAIAGPGSLSYVETARLRDAALAGDIASSISGGALRPSTLVEKLISTMDVPHGERTYNLLGKYSDEGYATCEDGRHRPR